jgi:hypothetical protein
MNADSIIIIKKRFMGRTNSLLSFHYILVTDRTENNSSNTSIIVLYLLPQDCLDNVRSLTSYNLIGLHGLLRG